MIVRQSQNLDAAQEQTLSTQILEQLDAVIEGQNYLRVVLLGGTYQEIVHPGRLPVLDTQLDLIRAEYKLLEKRTESLEKDRERWTAALRGGVKTASVIAGFVGAVSGTVGTIVVELILRR